MISKTRPTRDGALYRQISEVTRQTVRQLAEVTKRFAGMGTSAPESPGAAPVPTAAAVANPAAAQARGASPRDHAATEAMLRVKDRAMAHQAASRLMFTEDGPMQTIDPDYVSDHTSRALKLKHVGAAQSDGTCPYQQDIAVADWPPRAGDIKLAAVCDGHGPGAAGEVMPWHVLERNLIGTLRSYVRPDAAAELSPYRIQRALTRAIAGSRAKPRAPLSVVEQMGQCNAVDNGSTLVAAVQINKTIYVANVGDSRAVLVRKDGTAHELTVDHKTYEPEEQKLVAQRVAEGLASVERAFPHRMLRYGRDGNRYGINMSRSIGDDQATMSTPEISLFELSPDDVALVLCSDGVFDTVHSDQVGLYVSAVMAQSRANPTAGAQRAAEGLVNWCYDTEVFENRDEAHIDNMTALILPLQDDR